MIHSLHSLQRAALALLLVPALALPLAAQQSPENIANYKLAEKYGSGFLRKFVYSTSVRPSWIGKTDRFHYSYRTSAGTRRRRLAAAASRGWLRWRWAVTASPTTRPGSC